MSNVAKYNTYKGVSTALTFGTPIITMICCGDFFVHRSDTALSAAGIFTLLIVALFAKDKLMEYFKAPSAFVLSFLALILVIMIENITLPIKYVCIATMAASGVDELTFKRWYKLTEKQLPEIASQYKHIGFLFVTNKKLMEEYNEQKASD